MIHINKVAELTGVTVRTLRYYDKIGLLKPASKTEGGHRLYTNEEIKTSASSIFKKVGFPLQEIKHMLDFNEWDWSDSLKSQLSYVINEQKNLKKIELSLREMINGIALEGEESWIAIQKSCNYPAKIKIYNSIIANLYLKKRNKTIGKGS